MRKYIFLLIMFFLHIAARGQTGFRCDYWFDNDRQTLQTQSFESELWQMEVDVNPLPNKLHTIHLQVHDSEGNLSSPVTRYFYKASLPTMNRWQCWFDNNMTNVQSGNNINNIIMLDVGTLTDGYHLLHILVDGEGDAISTPITNPFIKIPQTAGVDYLTCLCMIDDQLYKQERVSAQGGVVEWQFDVSSLPQGLHRIFIQVITPSGAATSAYQAFFMRATTSKEFSQMKCVYSIDNNEFNTEAGTLENGTFHFDLDVSAIEDGLHQISYMLSNGQGTSTNAQTQFFIKTPLGGNGIAKYWYWLNEKSINEAQKVILPEHKDPFSLISLLPVETQPIRSCNFKFAIKDGQPLIYAKNEFHIRFYDASGRFIDATKEYADEQVSENVSPVGELLPTQTFPKVAENDIRWYTINVEPGDTVAFKSSQACTMQLFSPSGKEVYKSSASASVSFGGVHTWENGTYYLAVHDVTGTQSNMTLEYMHTGKYAVLSHSPEEVGVMEGNFYIKLFGNGYDKLTKAQLKDGNNSLTADVIQILDISNVILQYSFPHNNYPRGNYDLILEFADDNETETIIIEDAVTIADPIFGDIAVDVTSHPTVAKPYPVTITIRNTGNVTYQFVPLYFANSINQLESVHLLNFGLQSSKNVIDAGIKTFYKVENLFGEDSCIVIPTIIPFVNPYQELKYQIGFVTGPHAIFNIYAWTETPWSIRDVNIPMSVRKGPRKAPTTNITCEIDPCDLVSGIPNSGCVCGVLWGGVSAIANIYGATNQWRNNQLRKIYGEAFEYNGMEWCYNEIPLKTPADIIDQVISECLGDLIPDKIAHLQDAIENALEEMQNRRPEICPPPTCHPTNPFMPGDPNDIYGYTSESGTKFIADSIAYVNYTIEFENDTTLANASAHTIIIRDTLDSRYFDLNTFTPTMLKIGDRQAYLDGEPNFVKTIDMRPEINAIAQVTSTFDKTNGIATWTFQSLDPMTMEPTDDLMQGILPVNYNGTSGIGEVSFDIGLKQGKADGTEVSNHASIVFDYEKPILTPKWVNTVDGTAPTSCILSGIQATDSTVILRFQGEDNLSGVWKYAVYAQQGENAPWILAAENIMDTECEIRVLDGIEYGFCVVATDAAGNVEKKVFEREFAMNTFVPGDANGDGVVDAADATLAISKYLGNAVYLNFAAADVNGDGVIDAQDVTAITNIYLQTQRQTIPRKRLKLKE